MLVENKVSYVRSINNITEKHKVHFSAVNMYTFFLYLILNIISMSYTEIILNFIENEKKIYGCHFPKTVLRL